MTLSLSSPSFAPGAEMPRKCTCDGSGVSPQLVWDGVPSQARSLALIVDDPDAPDPKAPRRTYVHWVLYDLPPDSGGLAQGVKAAELPAGTMEGLNDERSTGYSAPCPPIGRHRYFHRLYALDVVLPDLGRPARRDVENAMSGHVLESVELMGTYERS